MTDRSHERDLWLPTIHTVWSTGTSRDNLNRKISQINNVRNRAAHHEHLFVPEGANCSTLKACKDAVELFSQLAPETCSYVYGDEDRICSVNEFVFNNPAPCDVVI